MAAPFAGLFTSSQAAQPAAPKGTFSGLFSPSAAPSAPVKTPAAAPITTVAPLSAPAAPIAPTNAASTTPGAPAANLSINPAAPKPSPTGNPEGDQIIANEKNIAAQQQTPSEILTTKLPALTQTLADLQTNPLNLGNSLKSIVETPWTDVKNASDAFNAAAVNFANGLKNKAPASVDINNGLQAATTLVAGALTPITTWFNVANKIPVVGDVSKLLFNVPFSVLGDVSGDSGVKALNLLPISQQAKQNLEPGVRAISTLAGQIVGGKYVAPDVMDMLSKHFGPEDAQTIVNKAQEVAEEAKANPNAPLNKPETPTPTEKPTETPANKTPEVAPVEGTGETKTSGLAQSVEQKAVEEKLTRGFGDLPEYKTVSMKDQAAKAVDLITQNYDQAKRIAMGQEAAPEGVLPESVFVAVENKALEDGDVSTLRDLATQSSLTGEATTMGQRIRTLGERDDASPVEAIKDVQSAREKAATAKLKGGDLETEKGKIAEDIKNEIRKTSPKEKDWSSFVKALQC